MERLKLCTREGSSCVAVSREVLRNPGDIPGGCVCTTYGEELRDRHAAERVRAAVIRFQSANA